MKKCIATLMSCILAVGLLTSCANNSDPGNSSNAPGSSSSGEEKLKITLPYKGEPVRFTGYGPEGVKQDENTPLAKAWREHVGNIFIDWELAPSSDYNEKVKVYLSAGNMPDVLPILDFKVTINQYGDSGRLLDFSKYEEYMPNLQAYRKGKEGPFMDSILNAKGQRFAIMGIQPIDHTGEGWQYNKTLLDECGVKVPDTFDEFVDAMKKVKAKRPDVIPFQTYWNLGYTQTWIANALGAQNELIYYDPASKSWKFSYREESAKRKELISKLAMMYKEKLINPEIATMSNEQEKQQLTSAKWAFTAVYNGSIRDYFKADKSQGSHPMPIELGSMLPPKAPDGKRYLQIAYIHDYIPGWGIVCSGKAKNPEFLAAYMDAVVSPFAKNLWNFGVEGVTYDTVNGKPQLKDNFDRKATGFYTQYEIWTVGMGPDERFLPTDEQFYKDMWNMNLKALESGELQANYQKGIPIFTPEDGAKRSTMENDLKTFVSEQEAKFIYGNRPMSDWDKYVKEIESYVKIDDLLELYKKNKTIDISGPRIWQGPVK